MNSMHTIMILGQWKRWKIIKLPKPNEFWQSSTFWKINEVEDKWLFKGGGGGALMCLN